MTTADLGGRRTLSGATRPLEVAPFGGYRGGQRAPRRRPSLVRDFTTIFGVWAVTAYPILWFSINVIGPALFGGTP